MPHMDPVGYDWLWKRSNPSAKRIQPIWHFVKDSKDLRQKTRPSTFEALLLSQLCQLVNSFWHHQMMGQVGRDPSSTIHVLKNKIPKICQDSKTRQPTTEATRGLTAPQNIASTVKLANCISMWFWQIMCGRIRRILPRCAGCRNVQFDEVMKDTLNPSLSDNMIGCFWVP